MRMPGEAIMLPTLPADHPCAACDIRMRTFCAILDERELAAFKCLGDITRVEAHQPIFHQGDPADLVYNVTRGTLKLYRLLPDGRRQVTGFLQPGDFLGLTEEEEHGFTAETLEPAELCRFPRGRFEAFIADHPQMGRELYRLAAHELAAAQEQMVLLGRKTAIERVASFLLGLVARAAPGDVAPIVHLPMSRLDIADYLGLTKETVSREFTALKTSGVIRLLNGNAVCLRDRARLEEIAICA